MSEIIGECKQRRSTNSVSEAGQNNTLMSELGGRDERVLRAKLVCALEPSRSTSPSTPTSTPTFPLRVPGIICLSRFAWMTVSGMARQVEGQGRAAASAEQGECAPQCRGLYHSGRGTILAGTAPHELRGKSTGHGGNAFDMGRDPGPTGRSYATLTACAVTCRPGAAARWVGAAADVAAGRGLQNRKAATAWVKSWIFLAVMCVVGATTDPRNLPRPIPPNLIYCERRGRWREICMVVVDGHVTFPCRGQGLLTPGDIDPA
ncbi:hypothetical protein JB92DRAFT_2830958 [Gautieria morchelliformis]|nr:hypothetical protein JB92DRAFT_2830958 [Gautieria morchelliformis]